MIVTMVATNGEPDLSSLSTWQAALARQAEELRGEIRTKQTDLAQVEERLTLVTKLIEMETRAQAGAPAPNSEGAPTGLPMPITVPVHKVTSDLEDAVEEILRAAGEPLHISNIRETLVAQGVSIPGRGDDANIIVRLRRFEDRFTRTARGTYGLAEWGIPALRSKTRKKRRTAAR
jgi:hypothetical protein